MGLRLMGEVGLDGSGFERGLEQIGESATHHLKGFVATAFGLYGIEEAIHKTVERAEELVTTSQRLGVGVQQLQLLKQAAKDNRTELESLTKAFEKLDENRAKALGNSVEGQKKMARFEQLGISREDLKSKTAAELFMGPIRSKANSMNPEDLGPVLKEVMGKGFGQLIPVLKTDFEELEAKMKSMGTLMDTQTAVKLKALGEEFSLLSQIITSQLGPALIKAAEWIYSSVLKGGKSVAGATAAAGAAGAGMSTWDQMWGHLKIGYASTLASLGGMTAEDKKAYLDGVARNSGFDLEAGQAASKEAQSPWEEKQKEFAAQLAKLTEDAQKLDHPTPPTLDVADDDPKTKKGRQFRDHSDALINVGNFLGGSRDVMADLAQKQVTLLQQIAHNTSPSPGDSGGTAFPPD